MHQVGLAPSPGGEETVISALERDALHRETLRTMGKRHQFSSWDAMSRLKARSGLQRFDLPLPEILQPIKKAYGYDKNGELTGRNDSFSGERHYIYDAVGRITRTTTTAKRPLEFKDAIVTLHNRQDAEQALFGEEIFAYDAASNLMATGTDDWSIAPREVRPSDFGGVGFDDGEGLTHVRHNRLKELDGFTFTYDAFGRTIEKKPPLPTAPGNIPITVKTSL